MDQPPTTNDTTTPASQHQAALRSPKPHPKGRVRTGCLTCRARKVKCDEQHPTCRNCARLKKPCIYSAPGSWRQSSTVVNSNIEDIDYQHDSSSTDTGANPNAMLPRSRDNQYSTNEQSLMASHSVEENRHELLRIHNNTVKPIEEPSLPAELDGILPNHQEVGILTENFSPTTTETPPNSYERTSQLIYFSTAMDWLGTSEEPTWSSFQYFLNEVDCPFISPFDYVNWTRIKSHIAHLGLREPSVAMLILAVQVVYRAQVNRLPMTHPMTVFQSGVNGFETLLENASADFEIIIISAFLLCLCVATLPNEDGPNFSAVNGNFVPRLEAQLQGRQLSPLCLRVCTWLLLLNTSTQRPGSAGLFAQPLCDLLYNHLNQIPTLSELDRDTLPENSLYDTLSAPIFSFYLEVQRISKRVLDITHYRRSRNTSADQAEVTEAAAGIKADMLDLWDNRTGLLRLAPEKLSQSLEAAIADPLAALVRSCIVAFHAETIVIGRILGDPPFPTPAAIQAKKETRDIIDQDSNNQSPQTSLNPAYVRPLFAYALESFEKEETGWAAHRLRQIQSPISRNEFLAEFVEAHGEAQRVRERRVTMKYFCYEIYGVTLPYM